MSTAAVSTEPRGIAAAMSQPVFTPKMGQSALGAADRATRRWAPEAPEDQPRGMRSLSFVDRMVSPWVTAAQKSAGLRMFSQYAGSDVPDRVISGVSWVFPRPWYQDELDWISASRANQAGQDMIFTTRGTYAPAADRSRESSLPPQLFEYVAPSFSPSANSNSPSAAPAYSPLVSHSSYSAASVVAQSMQAIAAASAMARGLPVRQSAAMGSMTAPAIGESGAPQIGGSYGSIGASLAGISSLGSMMGSLIPDGESTRFSMQPSAIAMRAPTLVTPPSPRGEGPDASVTTEAMAEVRSEHAAQAARSEREAQVVRAAAEVTARQEQSRAMAQAFAQERERVNEQMRSAAKERAQTALLEPMPSAAAASSAAAETSARESIRAEAIRLEAVRIERAREVTNTSRVQSSARQQARIDAIVAERVSRLEGAATSEAQSSSESAASSAQAQQQQAVASAPSEAQSQALIQALRMAELLAHTAAIGPSAMAPSAGPRMSLPTGLGGLVAGMNTVAVIDRERAFAAEPSARRQGGALPFTSSFQPVYTAPMAQASTPGPISNDDAAASPAMAPSVGSASSSFGASSFAAPFFAAPAWAPRAMAPEAMRVDSALGSIASRAPAALGHVAWADRWLGRFAGASEAALDAMSTVAMRARIAPSQLFVAPALDVPRQEAVEAPSRFAAPSLEVVAPARRQEAAVREEQGQAQQRTILQQAEVQRQVEAQRQVAAQRQQEALRFADDDVVPDELFAAISASSSARRELPRGATPSSGAAAAASPASQAAASQAAAAQAAAAQSASRTWASQPSAADIVALTAPSAPVNAGLSASLAASPMAPALGHVLPLPRAAVFDTRSLGGADLAAAFLSGAVTAPMVAQYSLGSSPGVSMSTSIGGAWEQQMDSAEAPSLWRQWSAELVRPAEQTRAAALRDDADVVSSAQRPTAAPASLPAASLSAAALSAASASLSADASGMVSTPAAAAAVAAAAAATSVESIITMRSTLLSPASPRQQRLAASSGTVSSWANQEPMDALPVAYQTLGELLSEAAPDRRWLSAMSMSSAASGMPGGLTAEGMPMMAGGWDAAAPMAERFDHGFPLVFWPLGQTPAAASAAEAAAESMPRAARIAQAVAAAHTATAATTAAQAAATSRASAWMAPESELLAASPSLVEHGMPGSMDRGALSPGMLAQRALGFGAVQSSQSSDLSFDFVPPELVLAARVYGFGPAEAAQAARLAMGGSTGLSAMAGAVDLRFISLMSPQRPGAQGPGATGSTSSGEAARSEASMAAAARPQSPADAVREPDAAFGVPRRMPRGAFLLPSASVAAMGLSAALPEGEHSMSIAALEVLAAKMVAELGSFASPATLAAQVEAAAGGESAGAAPARRAPAMGSLVDVSQAERFEGPGAVEASEAAVLSSASASIAASRRARFETLYVALAESNAGRTMSPAARAARALALANRDEESTSLSSRERAALAWQIFPVVLNGEGAPAAAAAESSSSESPQARGAAARGRSALELPTVSAVGPGAEMRSGSSPLSTRAGEALSSFVTAAPAAMGSSGSSSSSGGNANWRSGRYGGGEVEIPGWFEAAARKMFEERGDVEGISLAELTLVASTPPSQIAAADRAGSAAAPPPKTAAPDGKGEKGQKVDIEAVAADVYRAVMQLMESARMRNGEPYL